MLLEDRIGRSCRRREAAENHLLRSLQRLLVRWRVRRCAPKPPVGDAAGSSERLQHTTHARARAKASSELQIKKEAERARWKNLLRRDLTMAELLVRKRSVAQQCDR
mmetsp:Transcript_61101/g.199798  ORF Transcript_61101/g.199798 Transcript_61101/m.199798 type:complete len:107 (+) Transcript_61101:3-323(+)